MQNTIAKDTLREYVEKNEVVFLREQGCFPLWKFKLHCSAEGNKVK